MTIDESFHPLLFLSKAGGRSYIASNIFIYVILWLAADAPDQKKMFLIKLSINRP